MLKVEEVWTEDDLFLQGMHYDPESRDACLLIIHGFTGHFFDNIWAQKLGEILEQSQISCLYAHNRGYSRVTDIYTKEIDEDGAYKTKIIGAAYEDFSASKLDIAAWVAKVKELGYKKIFLLGHSLGCNKLIHFLSERDHTNISGLILASPPDMIWCVKQDPNFDQMCTEAKENLKTDPNKLLNNWLWDWCLLSSKTFLSLLEPGNPMDNLPVSENPTEFKALAKIACPVFAFLAEKDDIVINSLEKDLEIISAKATACPDFQYTVIPEANHNYVRHEESVAQVVLDWILGVQKSAIN